MTILGSAYNVCSYVRQLPFRASVANLMRRINFSNVAETDRDPMLDHLGVQGRNARAQFAGYIAELLRLRSQLGSTAGQENAILKSDELGLLAQAHQFILDLNGFLLSRLDPGVLEVVREPYRQFRWLPGYQDTREYDLDANQITQLCEVFSQHPACSVISETVPRLNKLILDDFPPLIQSQADRILAQIHAAGCEHAPPEIMIWKRQARTDPKAYWRNRMLAALVALECSLINLNQLIYQAFQHDKLPILNEKCVFHVSHGWNAVGHYASVLAVPTESNFFLEVGYLVHVKIDLENEPINNLYCVVGIQNSFSQDTGPEDEYHMRRVDGNLNCYEGLID